jgi:hypothetical protein
MITSTLRNLGVIGLVVIPLASGPATAAPAKIAYPNSMAALGDSLSLGYGTGDPNGVDSWSTGTSRAVNSHYLRILAANPAIKGKNYNFARAGFHIDLKPQAKRAVAKRVEYVTIMTGLDEACDATPPAEFAAQFDGVLRTLATGLPKVHIFVGSVWNGARLVQLLDKSLAGAMVCNLPAGVGGQKLAQLRQRLVAVNRVLAQVCAHYPQCRFDNNAVFKMPLTVADISPSDHLHPTLQGLHKLAEVTWKATFPFGRS